MGELNTELQSRTLEADVLYTIQWKHREVVLHVEFQRRSDANMSRRLWMYNAQTDIITGLPVYSFVIYLKEDGKVVSSPYERKFEQDTIYRFFFRAIIYEKPWPGTGVTCATALAAMTQESSMLNKEPNVNKSPFSKAFLFLGLPGLARSRERKKLTPEQEASSNRFLLQVVQPGLAGLMDGSVSTLAPIFAAAFATHKPLTAFLVGMAAATGAGISMAFSEALSDDGVLTGRGNPVARGSITGLMTFLGGAGHTLPFLIQDFRIALIIAYVVVAIELTAIAAIRHHFFGTRWFVSIMQVVGGGLLVVIAGLIFGSA